MMEYIDFTIIDKHIVCRRSGVIADNTDYMMRFAFDEGWDGYPDKTVLILDGKARLYEIHLEGGATEVKLPKFIGRKLLAVGVTATNDDEEIASDAVLLRVDPSIRTGASEVIGSPESGAMDMLEEYREKYETLIAELQAAIDSTYLGVTGAKVGQTVRITAVDEGGNPTEWEAVEFPEQVQSDWEQTDETAADYMKNRPFGNVAYDGIFFKRVPGGYNLVRVPDFNALAEIQGTRKAEIRRYGDVVNTGSADVSVSDYDGSISIKYTSAQTIIRFSGSYGTLNSINVQQDSGISNEGEYVLHIDGLYYEGYIKLSADKVEGTLPSASAADCVLISTGSGNNWSVTKISTDFPLASATGRGAVKVGDGLSISSDGKLSVDMSGLDTKSLGISGASVGQIVKIKTVDSSGVPTEWEPADMPSGSGGTDTSLGLTGATVGQTVKIKAVDENGIPTEWEATDMASGGEWHLIRSFTVPVATNLADDTSGITWFADESSNVFGFEINTDESGNAFSYHELYMRVRQAVTADAGDLPATIYINDIKIGQWHKAQVKLVNRVGEVKISRYANTYTVSYAGLSAFTSERNWVSSPALSNGIGFINSTDGAVEGNINKFKMLFAETNYMREGYLVSLWGR